MKKILIIGGTRFVGRNLIETLLLEKKYDITLFNRGITNPHLFPNIKKIKGDRKVKKDIQQITSKNWDYIIDISGYWPNALEQQLSLQQGNVGKYIYISTSSHYQFDIENPHLIQENEAIIPCTEEQKNSEEKKYYNQHKAECERILQAQKDLNYIILRPGLIIGKYDHTDRLYYWFHKMKSQEKILVPDSYFCKIPYTNINDLSQAIIQSLEIKNNFKIYNVSSFNCSIKDWIFAIKKLWNNSSEFIEATTNFLKENDVQQWSSLPLWLDGHFFVTDNSRIIKDYNFIFTSFEKTIEQLIRYYSEIKKWETPNTIPASLSFEKEKELIFKLRNNEF